MNKIKEVSEKYVKFARSEIDKNKECIKKNPLTKLVFCEKDFNTIRYNYNYKLKKKIDERGEKFLADMNVSRYFFRNFSGLVENISEFENNPMKAFEFTRSIIDPSSLTDDELILEIRKYPHIFEDLLKILS